MNNQQYLERCKIGMGLIQNGDPSDHTTSDLIAHYAFRYAYNFVRAHEREGDHIENYIQCRNSARALHHLGAFVGTTKNISKPFKFDSDGRPDLLEFFSTFEGVSRRLGDVA